VSGLSGQTAGAQPAAAIGPGADRSIDAAPKPRRKIRFTFEFLALKWVVGEPYSSEARALLDDWRDDGRRLLAPALFLYEVTNALAKRIQRRQLTLEQAKQRLRLNEFSWRFDNRKNPAILGDLLQGAGK